MGRFVEKKGFAVLLEAVARIERDIQLRLVGDGPLRAQISSRRSAGWGWTGRWRSNRGVPTTRSRTATPRADLVVVPSVVDAGGDRDGLPNVVLEAMASGRPVVAS